MRNQRDDTQVDWTGLLHLFSAGKAVSRSEPVDRRSSGRLPACSQRVSSPH